MEEVIDNANEIFVAVLIPIIGYLAVLARSAVATFIASRAQFMDEVSRQRLEAAFENAIASLEARGQAITLDGIIDWAKEFNPDDLRRFPQLAGEKLRKRVTAAVGKAEQDKKTVDAMAAAVNLPPAATVGPAVETPVRPRPPRRPSDPSPL
jgi:hypothetical protein